MEIFVKTMNGTSYTLDVNPSDTVELVKEKIQAQIGIPLPQQQLIFGGKQLENPYTLSMYSVYPGATLHLILRSAVVPLSSPLSSIYVPAEKVFPSGEESFRAINEWQRLGEKGDFDADTHIVAPQAHYTALHYLEQTIVTSSELHRQSGVYDLSVTPSADNVLSSLINAKIKSNAPTWIYDFMLNVQNDDMPSVDKQITTSLCQSYAIIQSVIDRFDLLVSKKFSSDFFSILLLRDEKDAAEIVKIHRTALAKIANSILVALSLARDKMIDGITAVVSPALEELCNVLGFEHMTLDVLETCRVLAYLLDLGLVCYVGSHGSRFDREYFKREIGLFIVNLQGAFGFDCRLRRLACLSGFLDARDVWVFDLRDNTKLPTAPSSRTEDKLSILTTIDALADIWGPVCAELVDGDAATTQPSRVKKYNVAKGCIRRVPDMASSSHAGFVKCHWYSWAEVQRRRLSRIFTGRQAHAEELSISLEDKLLIGTELTVNGGCDFSLQEYEMNYGDIIREAGPRPSSWRFDGVAVSLQLAAPKFVTIQIEGQTKRLPEKTVKENAWQKWNTNPERANPGILNNYYGVEISHCTGNARRVPLKEILLMEPVLYFLERQIPGWIETPWGKEFRKALETQSKDAVFQFWNQHVAARPQIGRLVSSVLDILDNTGITNSGFQAALLHQNYENVVRFETKRNDWMSLLKDSYLTATYAIVNRMCLEHRRPDHTTSVCNNEQRYSVFQTAVGLENGAQLNDHIKIKPCGLQFKKVDDDARGLAAPYLLTPETGSRLIRRLMQWHIEATELVNQYPHDHTRGYKVILRASQQSYGGMRHQRNRKLLAAATKDNVTNTLNGLANLAPTQEALSKLEIEAKLPEELGNQDAEGDRRAAC
ncbi:hypothetical protein HD806DRAFT_426204 [Xylariaceae sp. AK1471]|nr:hypothetical protein HD806DRAFT_426204 [Xylariaceae sp. AK1471]